MVLEIWFLLCWTDLEGGTGCGNRVCILFVSSKQLEFILIKFSSSDQVLIKNIRHPFFQNLKHLRICKSRLLVDT